MTYNSNFQTKMNKNQKRTFINCSQTMFAALNIEFTIRHKAN